MRLTNETNRPIVANIDGRIYEIPVDEAVDVEDYVVGSTLVEYGASASKLELDAARQAWAEQNRDINSRSASASASEGVILGNRQATVDVQLGTVTSDPEPLKGDALKAAVDAANEDGAGIKSSLTADEKRTALAEWQLHRGSSTSLDADPEWLTVDGELVLDAEGQPFRTAEVELDEDGKPVLGEDGFPVVKAAEEGDESSAGEGDASTLEESKVVPGTGGDPSAGTGGDGAGPDQGPTDPADPEQPVDPAATPE